MEAQCDYCGTEKALIYCKSDSAKLCLNCDVNVHSANPLSQRHTRSILCQKCFLQPTVVHCLNEKVSLCQGCHWTASSCTGLGHRLQSLNPYSGCPSPSDFSKIWSSILEPSVSNWVSPFDDCTKINDSVDWDALSTSMVTQTQMLKDNSSIFFMESNLPKVIEEEVTSCISNLSKCLIMVKNTVFFHVLINIPSSMQECSGLDLCEGINLDEAPLNFNASNDIIGCSSLDQTKCYQYEDSYKEDNNIGLSSLFLPALSGGNVVPSMSLSMSNITGESTTDYQDCGISPGFLIGDSPWDSNVEVSYNPKLRDEAKKRYTQKKSKRM